MSKSTRNKLNYRVFGNGYPVVFLHGFLESSSMWNYLSFGENTQQILIDLPGHGASELQSDQLSMTSVAEDVKAVIDELSLQEYHLVGHSMGGYIGLELKKIDARCEKIILLHSNFWEDSPKKKSDRLRVAKIVRKNKKLFIYEAIPNLFLNPQKNDAEVKKLIEEAIDIDAEVIAKFSIAMSDRNDNAEFVVENKKDILIIQGKEDAIVSYEKMNDLATSFDLQITEIEDCGHMGHVEKSREVSRVLKNYLAKG